MRCSDPALALWLQPPRPVGRVAELGLLGGIRTACAKSTLSLASQFSAVSWP